MRWKYSKGLQMRNVYTALVTPFVDNKIDYKSLKKMIEKQNDSEVVGVVALGSTGEERLLEEKEKIAILQFVKRYSKKLVIAGICSSSTQFAGKLATKYELLGADSLLVCPPPFVGCNQTGLIKHFEMVQNCTNLPIILYNVPHRTGFDIDVATISKIANVCNLWGVKECNDDVAKLGKYQRENIKLFCGNDSSIDMFEQAGCNSVISVASNLCPNVTVKASNKLLFDKLTSLTSIANPSVIKYALYCAGITQSYKVRLPLTTPSRNIRRKIASIVEQYKEVLR